MATPKPISLRVLMYEKYGEDRFALACEIVSRWMRFETKDDMYSMEWVQKMCNLPVDVLDYSAAKTLSRRVSSFAQV